ncbi:DNA-binding protein [Victivallales bacterium CCUG 44730]|nr:DNA-binding protein [Victivallales bacterium CCUG 44730]
MGAPEGRPISAPTLRRYVREGKINPIRLSCRKVRYDEREVQELLNHGIETEGER